MFFSKNLDLGYFYLLYDFCVKNKLLVNWGSPMVGYGSVIPPSVEELHGWGCSQFLLD